jgi:serine protease Do
MGDALYQGFVQSAVWVCSAPSGVPGLWRESADFGMDLADLTPELRKEHNINSALNGPIVKSVVSESAADNASLSRGDVIEKVGLRNITSVEDFTRLMTEARDRGSRDILL